MTVKASKILKTVKKLGKESPDTVSSCYYFNPDGTPCCIVGHALAKHGIDWGVVSSLEDSEEINESTGVRELFRTFGDALGLENDLTETKMQKLRAIQDTQDNGAPWGDAINGE